MAAFLDNPMFFIVDDTEPILPIFQSNYANYDRVSRVVELADVGCDTETFSAHIPRGASDRRRSGAENFDSSRKTAKRLHNKPNEFIRRSVDINNNEGRSRNYGRKTRRDNYDDVYVANRDYNDSEGPYHDLKPPRNVSGVEENDYYDRFVNPRNSVLYPYRERTPRYDYSPDLESAFVQSIHVPRRDSTTPRWFAESDEQNIREMYDPNLYSGERKKRAKTFVGTNGSFDHGTEFEISPETMTQRDHFHSAANSVARNTSWDFIPFEDSVKCKRATFCELMRPNDRGGLQTTMANGKRSYIFDSHSKRIDTVDSEEEEDEFKKTLLKNCRENLSFETLINNARNRTSKNDATKEKCKILRLNTSNASSSREQSIKAPVDEQFLNISAEENSINTRSCASTEEKKIESPTIDKITEKEKGKERKFYSKLPIRTWKRRRTKEPAALHVGNDATNADVNREFHEVKKEATNDRSKGVKNDDVRVKDRAAANRNDVKLNKRFEAKLLNVGKPGSTSPNLKSTKETKGSGTKGTFVQRKKEAK
ncbi:hypothetical protein PUN28_001312 [Cardiocondyla obscurior]|uniref:Uncharacterized protein n=1 Tax=Cardiocondyla obscurior TaxID=286306 RepID=A0AAW2H4P9_9HYME